jgi:hypothetical protein
VLANLVSGCATVTQGASQTLLISTDAGGVPLKIAYPEERGPSEVGRGTYVLVGFQAGL